MSNIEIDPLLIARVIALSRMAGEAILAIYNSAEATDIEIKQDGSPVTQADLAAHGIIAKGLQELLPIPIISEEAQLPEVAVRHSWAQYWLVDPMDGTKEFIARNGEFTVNIALMERGVPRLGVVHVPVSDETYIGLLVGDQTRAEKYLAGKKIADLHTQSTGARFSAEQPLRVLISHSHLGEEMEALLQQLQQEWSAPLECMKLGSSLKFCWLAEGRADFYPRLWPTSEWDTAAGQAVLAAAGGQVLDARDLEILGYNRAESLLNPWFFAIPDRGLQELISCLNPSLVD